MPERSILYKSYGRAAAVRGPPAVREALTVGIRLGSAAIRRIAALEGSPMSQPETTQRSVVEKHHIDIVDPAERTGRARDLFPVWFSAN